MCVDIKIVLQKLRQSISSFITSNRINYRIKTQIEKENNKIIISFECGKKEKKKNFNKYVYFYMNKFVVAPCNNIFNKIIQYLTLIEFCLGLMSE